MLKGERRHQKKQKAFMKKYLANNRKSLQVIIDARINRIRKELAV